MRASDSELCHDVNDVNREVNEGNREGNEGNREGNLGRIIKAIRLNPRITIAELEKALSLSHATIERAQKSLQAAGRLRRVGGSPTPVLSATCSKPPSPATSSRSSQKMTAGH